MSLEITGIICHVSPVVELGPSFRKRDFVLDISFDTQDLTITSFACLQVVNAKCDMLDDNVNTETLRFIVGDKVKCTFKLKGTKNKHNDTYYNNLRVDNIVAAEQAFAPYVAPAPPVINAAEVTPYNPPDTSFIDDLPF